MPRARASGSAPSTVAIKASVWWKKVATFLTILGLADFFSQSVKWANAIHWLVSHYASAKLWLFSWLPLHVPAEWHDVIIITLITFSITNIGFHQKTGKTYAAHLVRFALMSAWELILMAGAAFNGRIMIKYQEIRKMNSYWNEYKSDKISLFIAIFSISIIVIFSILYSLFYYFGEFLVSAWPQLGAARTFFLEHEHDVSNATAILGFALASGAIVAWRWILGTLGAFATLLAINEAYVRWLEPFAQ